ncbi:MAG: DUF7674 family protein [Acidimicrobiales bacterium]
MPDTSGMFDEETRVLLEFVPEFRDRYLELVEGADGDPGAAAAFNELAEFVSSIIAGPASADAVLGRCFEALEAVACESEEAEELVGWVFLDSLSSEDLQRLRPWMGPRTLAVAESLQVDK